jgi:hypothetical protein
MKEQGCTKCIVITTFREKFLIVEEGIINWYFRGISDDKHCFKIPTAIFGLGVKNKSRGSAVVKALLY